MPQGKVIVVQVAARVMVEYVLKAFHLQEGVYTIVVHLIILILVQQFPNLNILYII